MGPIILCAVTIHYTPIKIMQRTSWTAWDFGNTSIQYRGADKSLA